MTRHFKQDGATDGAALDAMAQGLLGKDVPRIDGLAKVTGTATYAAEWDQGDMAEGVFVTATIPRGRVTRIDDAKALEMEGVLAVLAPDRMTTRPAQGTAGEAPQQDPAQVFYWGQPVAVVVAETFEQARDAAKHVALSYEAEDDAPLDPATAEAEEQEDETVDMGDFDAAMAKAAHSIDLEITTAGHASAAMEPHAAIAA